MSAAKGLAPCQEPGWHLMNSSFCLLMTGVREMLAPVGHQRFGGDWGTAFLPKTGSLCNSWKVREGALAASRCILKACGARCVTTCGARVTRRWCAGAGLRGGRLGPRRGPLRPGRRPHSSGPGAVFWGGVVLGAMLPRRLAHSQLCARGRRRRHLLR